MRIAGVLAAGILFVSHNLYACVEVGPPVDVAESEQLSQHLWDPEWSLPSEAEKIVVDEAKLMDLPSVNEHEMVAGGWWLDYQVAGEAELLTQHLWDSEWSLPSELEEIVVDEAKLMDLPSVNEHEMVAGGWWLDYHVEGEAELLTQHLWDEEWSAPIDTLQLEEVEALQLDRSVTGENETVATA